MSIRSTTLVHRSSAAFDRGDRRSRWSPDADVVLAVTDALLDAAGAGDIGQYFPSDDPRWKADSSHCAREANRIVGEMNAEISNIDVTSRAAAHRTAREAIGAFIAKLLAPARPRQHQSHDHRPPRLHRQRRGICAMATLIEIE